MWWERFQNPIYDNNFLQPWDLDYEEKESLMDYYYTDDGYLQDNLTDISTEFGYADINGEIHTNGHYNKY